MKKVVRFESIEEFQSFIKKNTFKQLGEGSEGICYLGKDGKAYKDFTVGCMADEYLVDEVITTDDVDDDSFVFPETLFAIDNSVVGYTSRCIPRDDLNYIRLFMDGLDHINFDKLIDAYGILSNAALNLANKGIKISDLPYNVMFDGEKLYGIDTCGYTREEGDLMGHNLKSVDIAMKDLFNLYVSEVYQEPLDTSMGVIPFLTMIERKYTSGPVEKGPQYSKN